MADTTITITDSDRVEAENILEQYLSDKITDGDFSKGGSLRDLAIGAIAYIFAYLKKERDYVKARQSLLLLGALSGTDVDDAVNEILSNWFITRKTGRKSTGTATIYLTSQSPFILAPTDRFYKTADLVFVPNITSSVLYREEDLLPIVNSRGVVTSYSVNVPLISTATGVAYDIAAGPFTAFSIAGSLNIIRVENGSKFSGGGDIETTEEMLERAPTAITVRDLNSPRSIDTTLKEEFSDVQDVFTVGFGDPEMVRDVVLEQTTGMRIHAGGMVDAYIRAPLVYEKTYTAEVGGVFSDSRPFYSIFRDDTVSDFSTINPGDIIEVYNAAPASEANRYFVESATKHGVYVSARSPFPELRPVVEVTGDDGTVEEDGSTIDTPSHTFADVEFTFYDGEVGSDQLSTDSYTFADADIGKWIQVRESSLSNNGTWQIVGINVGHDTVTLRDIQGNPPGFTSETGLTFDLLSSSDIGKYIRVKNSTAGNDGTWVIYQASGTTATLRTREWAVVSFLADETVSWELCTDVVDYSIGSNPPNYNNKVSRRISGRFTKEIQNDGRILLPPEPIYRITDVSFADSANPYASTDGRVYFPIRSNLEPDYKDTGAKTSMEYQVVCANPGEAPSGWQVMELDIGWPTVDPPGGGAYEQKDYFNGKSLRVTYDALSGYDSVWAYMLSGDQRIICGAVIPKGYHPVYLEINIPYKLTKNATSPLDTAAAAVALAEYITSFDPVEDIDVSDIMAFLRNNYTIIGQIPPFTIYYHLFAPDGRVIHYKTTDTVSIDPTLCIDPATDYIPNPLASPELVLADPLSMGISDNTVRYLSVPDLITFTRIG